MDTQERETVKRLLENVAERRAELDLERNELTAVEAYLNRRLETNGGPPAVETPDTPPKPPAAVGPYAGMSAAEAAEQILLERGRAMKNETLFEIAHAGGLGVANSANFGKALGRNPKFVKPKRAYWALSKGKR